MTGSVLFQLPGGVITDKYGRKKVIVYGTGLRVIASVFLFTARTWQWVIPGILLNSVAAIYMPAFSAIIADSMPKEKRGSAFGAYWMMTSLPSVFMPVVSGYYLDVMGIQDGVVIGLKLFTIATLVATLARAKYLEETLDTSKEDRAIDPLDKYGGLWKTARSQPRIIYAMLIVSIISGFILRMSWSFLPIYAYSVIGLTTTQYGILQSVATGIAAPLYLVGGMLSDKIGRVPCILLARGMGPIDTLGMLILRDFYHLLMAFSAVGLRDGLGGGLWGGPAWDALMTDVVSQEDRGRVNGMLATVTGVLTLPASYVGGLIYNASPDILLSLTALQFTVIPIILIFFKEPK